MGSILLLVAGIVIFGGVIKKYSAQSEHTDPTEKAPLTSTQPQSTHLEDMWANPTLRRKLSYDLCQQNFEAAFEARETGYKAAMEEVFDQVIQHTEHIDVSFIQNLHTLAMTGLVMTDQYAPKVTPGQFSNDRTFLKFI